MSPASCGFFLRESEWTSGRNVDTTMCTMTQSLGCSYEATSVAKNVVDGLVRRQGAVRTLDGSNTVSALMLHCNMFPESLTAATTPRRSGTKDLRSSSHTALKYPDGINKASFVPKSRRLFFQWLINCYILCSIILRRIQEVGELHCLTARTCAELEALSNERASSIQDAFEMKGHSWRRSKIRSCGGEAKSLGERRRDECCRLRSKLSPDFSRRTARGNHVPRMQVLRDGNLFEFVESSRSVPSTRLTAAMSVDYPTLPSYATCSRLLVGCQGP